MNINRLVTRIAERFARHPWWVLGVALLLSLLAAWGTAQLPIYTSRQALLPKNTEVTQRFDAFLKDFGAASDLIVVLEGLPLHDREQYAGQLAQALRQEPEIGGVTDRLDMQFFLQRAYLFMPPASFGQLDAAIQQVARMPTEKNDVSLGKALNLGIAWMKDHPPLAEAGMSLDNAQQSIVIADFFMSEWRRWLAADTVPASPDWGPLMSMQEGASGMTDGYFTSRDGRLLFVFVRPSNPSEDFSNLGPFIDKVKAVNGKLAQQAKAAGRPAPTVGLTGLPAVEYEEYTNIRRDIQFVIVTSAGLILALILLVVRSIRWALLIFVPMGLGVLWSLGLALATVGHLTIITAAFIAILFGLGADYGIFTSSRIAEERRDGKPLIEAIASGIGSSFIAVLTAGGASVLIFGVLATVDFPGFAELGIIAAKGVLMILVSTWMVQPAIYALLPPKLAEPPPASAATPASHFAKFGVFPTSLAVLLVAAALIAASLGTWQGLRIPFDYDVLAMLPENSQAAYYQRRMLAESDYQAEVVIYTAKDMDEARRITEAAGKLQSVAQVQSLTRFFPADAEARRQQAIQLASHLATSDYAKRLGQLRQAGLSPPDFQSLQTLLGGSLDLLDEAQEQAFSSGHADLVKGIESLRENVEAIQTVGKANPAQARERSESFFRALLGDAESGLNRVAAWRQAQALTLEQLPAVLQDRFISRNGKLAVYAFPAKSVYDPDNLDQLMRDVYSVSPNATGFPTTHQAFATSVVKSFSQGTVLALIVCLAWILLVLRSVTGFALASLPLMIGGGWMLGLMSLLGIRYNFANIVSLPLVIALAVDYGVWFSYRWRELKTHTPLQVSWTAGKVIGLAASTELAGLGAITLASYRGVSSLGASITIGLLCCLAACLLVAPAIGQLLDPKRKQ